jgi:1L-myo-inositol 1-phosphate cytidylyltransferase
MASISNAIILAAGRGSRLDPGGDLAHYSKPLLRLGDKTLLERTVGCCRRAGAERVIVVTGFRAELVKQDIARYGEGVVETVYNPDWQRANGLSLYACRDRIDNPFALTMADHLFDPTILADMMAEPPRPGTVTLAIDRKIDQVFDLDDATKVLVGEDGRIRRIHKQLDEYNAVDCGLFVCTPAIFGALSDAMIDGDCSLSDGMAVIGQRGDFLTFDIGDRKWQDVDTPEMLAQAEALVSELQ